MATITEKQHKYITSLLTKNSRSLNRDIGQLSKDEARLLIGYLIRNCEPKDEELEKFFSDYVQPVKEPEEDSLLPGNLFPVDTDESLPF